MDSALAEARRLLPLYDTGAWSLYDRSPTKPGIESDLSYHQLFAGFLDQLCTKFADPFCAEAENFNRYETEPIAITVGRDEGAAQAQADHRELRPVQARQHARDARARTAPPCAPGAAACCAAGTRSPGRCRRRATTSSSVKATSLNGIASEASYVTKR